MMTAFALIILVFAAGMFVFGSLCQTAPVWGEPAERKSAGVPGTLAAVAAVLILCGAIQAFA